MRVNFLNNGQNNFFRIQGFNQSIARQNGSGDSPVKAERGAIVTISPQGRIKNLLEGLMKQKMNVLEQKNALIGKTLEKEDNLDSIKVQLEAFDEQLQSIDEQIAGVMAKEMEKQAEKMKPKGDKKPKTEEELQTQRLASLSNMSGDLQQAKTVRSVKARMDGDARVLKSEIELDKARDSSLGGAKAAKLLEMKRRSMGLNSKIADKLADISEKTTNNSKPHEAVPETENEIIDDK